MTKGNRFTRLLPGVVLLVLPAQAPAQHDLGSVIAVIDQGFVCPQFLPDDAARQADMTAFSRALATVGPKRVTYRQAAYIRAKLLARHNCTGDADALAAAAMPAATPVKDAPN